MKNFFIILLIVCLAGWNIFLQASKPKIVYVNISKLLERYRFRGELEGRMNAKLTRISEVVDSMKLVRDTERSMGYNTTDTNIACLQYEMQLLYNKSSAEITSEVWKRLNPLLEQYGRDNRYSILIGANGAGSVLYGSEAYDVTEKAIVYVNSH